MAVNVVPEGVKLHDWCGVGGGGNAVSHHGWLSRPLEHPVTSRLLVLILLHAKVVELLPDVLLSLLVVLGVDQPVAVLGSLLLKLEETVEGAGPLVLDRVVKQLVQNLVLPVLAKVPGVLLLTVMFEPVLFGFKTVLLGAELVLFGSEPVFVFCSSHDFIEPLDFLHVASVHHVVVELLLNPLLIGLLLLLVMLERLSLPIPIDLNLVLVAAAIWV